MYIIFIFSLKNVKIYSFNYGLHKNFYQYMLHQDQLKEFFSKSGYINRPDRSRLTARNLEATTLLSFPNHLKIESLIRYFYN
ncbi:hypothetical protein BpHYR1_018616 [Brachionus plicatilis]|uniref:Uncharacterized protein n=1 Tax=Brachionus plicatilis TaxID=10195 RepID=A0A3M7SIZ3_BRAPC|nr:hypothetical protein BpHYR1_018616 [Brachionus plicatilis]